MLMQIDMIKIFDAKNSDIFTKWIVVDDNVMGGISEGKVQND